MELDTLPNPTDQEAAKAEAAKTSNPAPVIPVETAPLPPVVGAQQPPRGLMNRVAHYAGGGDVQEPQVTEPAKLQETELTLPITDMSNLSRYNNGAIGGVKAVVFHHTGGRGTVEGTIQALNGRGLMYNYIIDRDGKVYQSQAEGTRGAHMRPSEINGLTNSNTLGVSLIAGHDGDLTQEQIKSAGLLRDYLAKRHGFDPKEVYGHGELNSHKQRSEGATLVNLLRGTVPRNVGGIPFPNQAGITSPGIGLNTQDLRNARPEPLPQWNAAQGEVQRILKGEQERGFWGTMGDAVWMNPTFQLARIPGAYGRAPDLNYEPDIKKLGEGLDPRFHSRFASALNADHAQAIRANALAEQDTARRLGEAGWGGIGAQFIAGMVDPINVGVGLSTGWLGTMALAARGAGIGTQRVASSLLAGTSNVAIDAGVASAQNEALDARSLAFSMGVGLALGGMFGNFTSPAEYQARQAMVQAGAASRQSALASFPAIPPRDAAEEAAERIILDGEGIAGKSGLISDIHNTDYARGIWGFRLSAGGQLARSLSPVARVVGAALGIDTVGRPGGQVLQWSADQAATRLELKFRTEVSSTYIPAYQEWAKEQGNSWIATRGWAAGWKDFGRLVADAIEDPDGLGHHPAVMKAANKHREVYAKYAELQRDPGSFRGQPQPPAPPPTLPEGLDAFHGSPHQFDAFSMDKIGTGEGAQIYGHGLYFAQNRATAESYRDGLSDPGTGMLYQVKIVAKDDELLNMDQHYAAQPPAVQKAMDELLGVDAQGETGTGFYWALADKLGSPSAASQAMLDKGIPGLKYLDALSRGGPDGTGTHNYVVWDDSKVWITHKNDVELALPEPARPPGLFKSVRGAEGLEADPNYMHRIWSGASISEMRRLHGDEAVYDLIAGSLRSKSPEMDEALAMKIAKHVVNARTTYQYGDDNIFSRMANARDHQTLRYTIKALMDDVSEDDLDKLVRLFGKNPHLGKEAHLKRRTLDVDMRYTMELPDGTTLRMKDLFERDADAVMQRYLRKASGRVALASTQIRSEADGRVLLNGISSDADFEALKRQIMDDYRKGGIGDINQREDLLKKDLDNLEFIYRRIVGRPTEAEMAEGPMGDWMRVVRSFNFTTGMGNLGLAQLMDYGRPMAALGLRPMLQQISVIRRMRDADGRSILASGIDRDLESIFGTGGSGRMHTFQSLDLEEAGNIKGLHKGRLVDKAGNVMDMGTHIMAELSGANWISQQQRYTVGRAIAQKFANIATKPGRLTKSDRNMIRFMGLDDATFDKVIDQVRTHFTMVDGSLFGRKVVAMNLDQWDAPVRDAFENALFRYSRHIVQENDIGALSRWTSRPLAKMIMQFQNYALVAYENQLVHGLAQWDGRQAAMMAWSLATAALVYTMQTKLQAIGRSDSEEFLRDRLDDPVKFSYAVFQRAGWATMAPKIFSTLMLATPAAGYFDNLSTNQRPADFLFGNPTFGILNNSFGFMKGIMTDIHRGEPVSQQTLRTGQRLMMFGSLPYFAPLSNLAISGQPEK